MKSFLDISNILVDAELIYYLSSLDKCGILHLLIFDWSNTSLIHVTHPHVILFLLLINFVYFGMYLLSDLSPIQFFYKLFLHTKNFLQNLVISYHCVALVLVFKVDVSFYLPDYHQFWQTRSLLNWGNVLHEGDSQYRHIIHRENP